MAAIRFVPARPAGSAFAQLFETTGWNAKYHATHDDLQRALEGSWFVLCAYDGERLVGVGRLVCDGVMHAMIYDLIVHPDYRRRGIGSALLQRLIAVCREAGVRDVQLFAARGATSFYERHGFTVRPDDAPGMELSQPDV